MTTPPLDLPAERLTALREIAKAATPGPWVSIPGAWGGDGYIDRAAQINGEPEIAVCDYDADRDHIAAFDPPTVLALLDRVEAAERDLAAVTVSRDGWQTRAKAAERAVAAARELHAHKHYDKYGRSHKEPQGHGAWCTFCGNAPDDCCATIKALDGTL